MYIKVEIIGKKYLLNSNSQKFQDKLVCLNQYFRIVTIVVLSFLYLHPFPSIVFLSSQALVPAINLSPLLWISSY